MSDRDTPAPGSPDDVLEAVEATEPDAPARTAEPPEPPQDAPQAQDRTPPPPPPAKGGSGALLGGVIGAVLALGAGWAGLRYAGPQILPMPDTAALQAELDAQKAELAALAGKLAELPAAPAADPDLAAKVAALETAVAALPQAAPAPDLTGLQSQLDGLKADVAALAARPALPAGDGAPAAADPALSQAVAALQAQVTALQDGGSAAVGALDQKVAEVTSDLAAARAEAQKLAEASAGAAQAALTRAALSRLDAALDSGVPFEGALADLALDPVPEALAAHAAAGVPTQQDLVDSFPDAARAALDASLRATQGDSWTDRVMTFLRVESGMRSLDPREGDDPDAILSRAEAAVRDGRIADAMTELAALPPAGQAAMQGWIDQAQIRLSATDAARQIAASLGQE